MTQPSEKISEMTERDYPDITGNESVPVVQTTNYRILLSNIKKWIVGNMSDAYFSIKHEGGAYSASTNLSALLTNVTWTFPSADINFGDLPNVATTSSNSKTGTRTRILGGSSNTVTGTDNTAITSYSCSMNGTKNLIAQCNNVSTGVASTLVNINGGDNIKISTNTGTVNFYGSKNITGITNGALTGIGDCNGFAVLYKQENAFPFPDFSNHTLIGCEDGLRSYMVVYGSNGAGSGVDLTSTASKKVAVCIPNSTYRKGSFHLVRITGHNNTVNPTKLLTVAYKVPAYLTAGTPVYAIGTAQVIEALTNVVGAPAAPTVTFSVVSTDRLNINIASADAMTWSAQVDSYHA